MKNLKKYIAVLLFLAMLPMLCGTGNIIKLPNLTDVKGHWAEEYINECVVRGIISGYPDETFKPSRGITRAEFIKMVVTAFSMKGTSDHNFTDITGHWSEPYIKTAYSAKIITDTSDSMFNPNKALNRQDMALILTRIETALGKTYTEVNPDSPFIDEEYVRQECKPSVRHLQRAGILDGRIGNMFDPFGDMTRAEAVKVIIFALRSLENSSGS